MSVSSFTVGGKVKFKIVLLGDQSVGKTSIIDRFINDRFQPGYNATIGIDFLVRNIAYHNKTYRLQLWDTAGQQRFRALIPSYLKDSHCGLIVYDLSDSKTLQNVAKWLDFYHEHKELNSAVILVGNKSDLPDSQNSCDQEIIKEKVEKLQIPHYKVSAKTGAGIKQLFEQVVCRINQCTQKFEYIQNSNKKEHENGETASTVFPKSQPIKIKDQNNKEVNQMQSPCC